MKKFKFKIENVNYITDIFQVIQNEMGIFDMARIENIEIIKIEGNTFLVKGEVEM